MSWRIPLEKAIKQNSKDAASRYVQVATIAHDTQAPSIRTIVFRGFSDSHLAFVTDSRSQKIRDIQRDNRVEVCWYFANTREQFRISGEMYVLPPVSLSDLREKSIEGLKITGERLETIRKEYYERMSPAGRESFAWPCPGSPIEAENWYDTISTQSEEEKNSIGFEHFCVLLMDVKRVDHLQLRGKPQQRRIFELNEGDWKETDVYP